MSPNHRHCISIPDLIPDEGLNSMSILFMHTIKKRKGRRGGGGV